MEMKKLLAAALVCVVTVFPLTGCGQSGEDNLSDDIKVPRASKQVTDSAQDEEAAKVRTLGTETNNAYSVLLTNQTGQSIISLKVGTGDSIAEESNLLEGTEAYTDNEQVELFYTPPVSEDTGESEKELTPEYEMALTLADGTEHILHGFPFDDIAEGVIKVQEEGIAYLSYQSVATGQTVETLDAEKAIINQAREEAERAAAEKAAAEAKAAAEEAEKKAAEESQKAASSPSSDAPAAASDSSSASSSGTSSTVSSGQGNSAAPSGNGGSTGTSSSSSSGKTSSGSSSGGSSTVSSGSSSGSGSSGSGSSAASSSGSTSTDSGSGGSSSGTSGSGSDSSSGSSSSESAGDDDDGCVGDGLTW